MHIIDLQCRGFILAIEKPTYYVQVDESICSFILNNNISLYRSVGETTYETCIVSINRNYHYNLESLVFSVNCSDEQFETLKKLCNESYPCSPIKICLGYDGNSAITNRDIFIKLRSFGAIIYDDIKCKTVLELQYTIDSIVSGYPIKDFYVTVQKRHQKQILKMKMS